MIRGASVPAELPEVTARFSVIVGPAKLDPKNSDLILSLRVVPVDKLSVIPITDLIGRRVVIDIRGGAKDLETDRLEPVRARVHQKRWQRLAQRAIESWLTDEGDNPPEPQELRYE